MKKDIEYMGKYYTSNREIADDLGLSYKRFSPLMTKHNDNIFDALDEYYQLRVEYDGDEYESYIEMCEVLKIDYKKFNYYRHVLKYSVEKAVLYCRNDGKMITYKDKRYKSFKEMCDELNIVYPTFLRRLKKARKEGKSYDKVVDDLLSEQIIYGGRVYSNPHDFSTDTNLPYWVLRAYIERGYDLNKIIECIYDKYPICMKGKYYITFTEFCKDVDIDYDGFMREIRKGVPHEHAYESVLLNRLLGSAKVV